MATKNRNKRNKTSHSKATDLVVKGSVSSYINSSTPQQISQNIGLLFNSPIVKSKYYRKKDISKDELFSTRLAPDDEEKFWTWCISYILHRKVELEEYIELEGDLTELILDSNWELSLSKISEIEERFGVSVKVSKIKAAILDINNEDVDGYIDSIKNVLFKHIIEKSIKRKNGDELFEYNIERYKNEILTSSLTKNLKSLLEYHLFPPELERKYSVIDVASVEANNSLIDLHDLLMIEINNYHDSFSIKLKSAIDRLAQEKSESFTALIGASYLNSVPKGMKCNSKYIAILDNVFEGKECELDRLINDDSDITMPFSVLVELSKSDFIYRSENFISEVLSNLKSLKNRNDKYEESREWLLSKSYKFRSLGWFRQLWLHTKSEGKYLKVKEVERYRKSILSTGADIPNKIEVLALRQRIELYDLLITDYKNSTSLYYYSQLFIENNKTKIERKLSSYYQGYCRANASFLAGDYKTSEIISKEMSHAYGGSKRLDLIGILIKSLFMQKKYDDAVNIFVSHYLKDRYGSTYFDLTEIIEKISGLCTSSKNINYPIILTIYKNEVGDRYETLLELSFESFLLNNRINHPEDMICKSGMFDSRKISYFLEEVCSQQLLESYVDFDTEKEAKDCRIKICQHLIDKGNESLVLSSELLDLKRQRLLKKLKRQVDLSRIYVDTAAFNGRDSQTYRILFNRYLELRDTYDDQSDPSYDIYKKLNKTDSKVGLWDAAKQIISIKPDSNYADASVESKKRKDIFYSIVTLFREVFVNGEKGLNNYLSTRIRHGVLPSALREPMTNEDLYLPEDAEFKDWCSKQYTSIAESNIEEMLFKQIKDHSKLYDEVINIVNNEYLQIETISSSILGVEKTESKRLFTYYITSFEAYALEQQLSPRPSYEELVKVILDFLWKRTDSNLRSARNKLRDNVQASLLSILNDFKSNLNESNIPSELTHDYYNRIDRVRNNLKIQITKVSSWFTISNEENTYACKLEDIVDIVSESLGVEVIHEALGGVAKLRGDDISYFVDFFTILIENAISKSGLSRAELDLSISFSKENDGGLMITSSNLCSRKVYKNNGYKFYLDAYGDEELAREVVQSEGGSGFFKIWNLLAKNLGINHSIEIKKSDGCFVVSLKLEASDRVYWE